MRRRQLFRFLALAVAGAVFTAGPGSAAPATAREEGIPAARLSGADGYLRYLNAIGHFNGSVLVASGDRILLEKPYGFADFESRRRLTRNSIFRVGSLTKPVTAAAILAAVDDGLLRLDTRFCSLVDYCPRAWREVTIAQLLAHTSGIPDHFTELPQAPVEDTEAELRKVASQIGDKEQLASAPGATFKYSNFNYVLLGVAVEKVRKKGWREVIRDMAQSAQSATLDYDAVFEIVPERARGYEREKDRSVRNISYVDHSAYSAGGLRSTIGDFFRWSRAALQGRLFSTGLRDAMLTPGKGNYGYGWEISRFHGLAAYNHNGGIDGFKSHVAYYPDRDITLVVFTNVAQDSAYHVACDIAGLMLGEGKISARGFDAIRTRAGKERCGTQ